jgi:nucleotide-binding universal stress UspA family protein
MFRKVLLAIDGSEESKRAVETTMSLAEVAGSEVLVYHVMEREVGQAGVFDMEPYEHATQLVDEAVGALKDAGVNAHGEVNRGIYGRAATEILDKAKEFDADMIVMGSRGLTDLTSVLVGSVTHKVLHLTHTPVLVVR